MRGISDVINLAERRNLQQNREMDCKIHKNGGLVVDRVSDAQKSADGIGAAMSATIEAYDATQGVREIRGNYRSNTGFVPYGIGKKPIEFESTLERDFVEQALFDPLIGSIHQQPLRISYTDEVGQTRTYTPDFLVKYRSDGKARTGVIEIKLEADLEKDKMRLERSFEPMRDKCTEKGWDFFVLTERTIRSQYQKNVQAILPFRHRRSAQRDVNSVHGCVNRKGPITIGKVLEQCAEDAAHRAEIQAVIWSLISRNLIWVDMTGELRSDLLLRSNKSSDVRFPFFIERNQT